MADCLQEGRLLKTVYEKALDALRDHEDEEFAAYRDSTDDINRVAFMDCNFEGLKEIGETSAEWWMGFWGKGEEAFKILEENYEENKYEIEELK